MKKLLIVLLVSSLLQAVPPALPAFSVSLKKILQDATTVQGALEQFQNLTYYQLLSTIEHDAYIFTPDGKEIKALDDYFVQIASSSLSIDDKVKKLTDQTRVQTVLGLGLQFSNTLQNPVF